MYIVHFAEGPTVLLPELGETSESYSTQYASVLNLSQPFEFWFEEPHKGAIPVLKHLEFLGLSSVGAMLVFHHIASFVTS